MTEKTEAEKCLAWMKKTRPVIEAYLRGEPCEMDGIRSNTYSFTSFGADYAVAPKYSYKPYGDTEVELMFRINATLRRKSDGAFVVLMREGRARHSVAPNLMPVYHEMSGETMLKNFEHFDGSPCGWGTPIAYMSNRFLESSAKNAAKTLAWIDATIPVVEAYLRGEPCMVEIPDGVGGMQKVVGSKIDFGMIGASYSVVPKAATQTPPQSNEKFGSFVGTIWVCGSPQEAFLYHGTCCIEVRA